MFANKVHEGSNKSIEIPWELVADEKYIVEGKHLSEDSTIKRWM